MQLRSRIMVTAAALGRMRFRRIAAVTAAVALMTGSGIPAALAQPVPGRAPAQSCRNARGFLVNGNGNLGVHLAAHNGIDTVVRYPGPGVTSLEFVCLRVSPQGSIWGIGAGGLCLDEGSASQQNLVFSEGCNYSLTTERWILNSRHQLENNHFSNCLSSGNLNGATLGGRSCSPTNLNEWFLHSTDNSSVSSGGRGPLR
jgi:hypothetical protein